MMAATMESPRSMPAVTMIRSVIPISVIPDNGDQFVRPIASDKIMPDIQIQSVPITAIPMPRNMLTDSTELTAITARTMAEPTIAKYNILIGISSPPPLAPIDEAFCIDLTVLMMSGKANATPISAPPINIPMPSGRYNNKRSDPGSLIATPTSSNGKSPNTDSIGDRNQ